MNTHQSRRLWLLWMPTLLAGITLIAYSAALTPTLNGATILGTLTALAGLAAAAHDNRSTR